MNGWPGEQQKASNSFNTDEVDGRMGNKGGQPGTSNALNTSEEGQAMKVGGYEVVQAMSTITYIYVM